jgi:hypothetical protein
MKATRETEPTQGNIQDWLQLDEAEPGFQTDTVLHVSTTIGIMEVERTGQAGRQAVTGDSVAKYTHCCQVSSSFIN